MPELRPVYSGEPGDIRILAMFSGGASSAQHIHSRWPLVAAYTENSEAKAIPWFKRNDVPVVVNDMVKFYEEAGQPNLKDMQTRRRFDARGVSLVDELLKEQEERVDVVIASGYMKLVTEPWLQRYPVLNVHPADLRVLDQSGHRAYTGDRAVPKALRAGEQSTRSTIHFMNGAPDQGPLLVVSDSVPVRGLTPEALKDDAVFANFADVYQGLMKTKCDLPAFAQAVELVAYGRVAFDDRGAVYVDGKPVSQGLTLEQCGNVPWYNERSE